MVTDERPDPIDTNQSSPGDPMNPTATVPDITETPTERDLPAIKIGVSGSTDGTTGTIAPIISLKDVSFYYGSFRAVKNISIEVPTHRITALIGPSGCGKSTLLRTINRMNDLIPGTRVEGAVSYHDENIYATYVDPVEVRRRIGMVFQKPNPFPKSIYDNVAFGPRLNGYKGDMDSLVESR
jgi:ABC-type phosphate transport system ATPase subunit